MFEHFIFILVATALITLSIKTSKNTVRFLAIAAIAGLFIITYVKEPKQPGFIEEKDFISKIENLPEVKKIERESFEQKQKKEHENLKQQSEELQNEL